MIQEVRIVSKESDARGSSLLHEIRQTLNIQSIQKIEVVKVFRFEGLDQNITQHVAQEVLTDPINEYFTCNDAYKSGASRSVEIGFKPGVMNPEINSLCNAVKGLNITSLLAADSSVEYHFFGSLSEEELETILNRLLINKTIAQKITTKPTTLVITDSHKNAITIPLRTMSVDQLLAYAKLNQLFLNHVELQAIKTYFEEKNRDPFDIELETIAQTWSEHCSHKTFKSVLYVDGNEKNPLFTRLKQTASKFSNQVISAFVDNAGVFNFYDGYAIAAKVETHNSPSAIEPYGGAATGSGGVFRDIMGTGLGAQIIASTDVFCLASPNLAIEQVPPGCLHPRYLLRHVVAGVRDYGNRMGVPTNNGSVHFHEDFRAKPTVIVGAYGLIPIDKSIKGVPLVNDRIFVIGGATGRDGIHGATFSSGAMTAQTSSINATAVQIGNPIEQKRMADALLVARDAGLIRAITDCGAGGFSSAIGEIAASIGASIELLKVPLKYPGLSGWEIWISESQERMVCAIDPDKTDFFNQICSDYNVQATDIGYFSGDHQLTVTYANQVICDLDMNFLHDGNPQVPLFATSPKISSGQSNQETWNMPESLQSWNAVYKAVISHLNICSKEPIARQYDHMVQGMNVLPPYAGKNHAAPQDAAVLTPLYGKPFGLIISHGLNPILNKIDPYQGSLWAITEAMANLVAVGGNPADAALIDNFIWPSPDPESLWALDQAMDACIAAMEEYKIPFISGKDSLSSTYYYPDNRTLKIPPVLCISALGKIPNIEKTVSSDFKHVNSLILLIGQLDITSMAGSAYSDAVERKVDGTINQKVPLIDLKKTKIIFDKLHQLITNGAILACHDVSEGGIAVTIAEMCFGGNIGASIDLSPTHPEREDFVLFNETAGCFIVEVSQENYEKGLFLSIPHYCLGTTKPELSIDISSNNKKLIDIALNELFFAWQQPMKEVFNS